MVKRWVFFLALGSLLTFALATCGTAPPAGSGTDVHMNSANFIQADHSNDGKENIAQRIAAKVRFAQTHNQWRPKEQYVCCP